MIDKQKNTKLVYLDVETAPNVSYTWGMYEQNVIAFQQEWYMLSFSWKWEGGRSKVRGLDDYKTFKKDKSDDKELVREIWNILDSADIVVGHNIDRFDIRKINARFLHHGFNLPSTYKTIDTLKIARKMFMLNSNKLDHIARLLGLGKKVTTGGFDLWLGCMAGEKKAWRLMKKYNRQDVDLTDSVYKKLRPYITSHVNRNLLDGTTHNCPSCSSSNVQKRGYSITRVGKYQRWQCQDCSAWSQGEKINKDKIELR